MTVRADAARVVEAVAREGRTLETALAQVAPAPGTRPAVQSLAYGTVRWFLELEACLPLLLQRSPSTLEPQVRALVLVGLYQLAHGETPEHAAVAETVEAVRVLGSPRAAGLVNALLRRFQRERGEILAAAHADPEGRHAHPGWLIDALARDWPAHWQQVLEAGNRQPPMWLRVNRLQGDREAYRARLRDQGLEAGGCAFAPQALRLAEPVDVRQLPGFAEGAASVQDAAAQLAPALLDLRPGQRVLDACAAPGGKTGHLLESEPALARLVALDIDQGRVARIEENLRRLGLQADVVVGDAAAAGGWWDGQPFDRILLDVPCSGTGVIRRHPDIKLLRRAADITGFVAQQRRLLEAAFALLAPGGRLLYSSCSVLAAENAGVITAFLGAAAAAGAVDVTSSARLSLPDSATALDAGPGLALPSGAADADGFYYACLEKQA